MIVWTTTKPTTPGWYFHRNASGSRGDIDVVRISFGVGARLEVRTRPMPSYPLALEGFVGEWGGPIELPAEPPPAPAQLPLSTSEPR